MNHSECNKRIQPALQKFLSNAAQWDSSLCGTGAVYRLEEKFSSLVGHQYALAVSNATLGIWAVFIALGIRDAEVITTPYTWGGTLSGVIQTGNRPVFADIDRDTLTLDPEEVVRRITKKTKVILAADVYGYPSHGPALREIADRYGLILIQDCAQSFGARLGEHHTGWWADAAVFSFTWGKALFAGEGGMVVTHRQELFEKLVWQTQHPHRQLRDTPHLPRNEFGTNMRINPLAAAWGDAAFDDALVNVKKQIKRCEEILALLHRKRMSRTKVPDGKNVQPSFHVLTFEPACDRGLIEPFLGLESRYEIAGPPIEKPLYRHEVYQELFKNGDERTISRCRVAEEQCARRLRLVNRERSDI